MAVAGVHQAGLLLQTLLRTVLAARGKFAALGQVQRVGHRAGDGLDLGVDGVQPGNGEHQTLGIGMALLAVGEDNAGAGLFHHLAAVHDGHIIGHLVDDAQVMGDKDDGGAVLLLELVHQAQDLGLDGHVQGGGGCI